MAEEKEPEQIDAYMGTMELYQKIYDFLFEILKIFWNAKKKMHVTTHLLIAC